MCVCDLSVSYTPSAPEKTIRVQNIRRVELITTENEMYNKFLPKADQQAFQRI